MPHRVPILPHRVPTPRSGRGEALRGILLLIVMLSFIAACGGEKPSPPPAPAVATVNGEAISLAEFEKSLTEEPALAKGETPLKAEETESLKEAVLDNLIREKIMFQRAREIYLAVGEAELEAPFFRNGLYAISQLRWHE